MKIKIGILCSVCVNVFLFFFIFFIRYQGAVCCGARGRLSRHMEHQSLRSWVHKLELHFTERKAVHCQKEWRQQPGTGQSQFLQVCSHWNLKPKQRPIVWITHLSSYMCTNGWFHIFYAIEILTGIALPGVMYIKALRLSGSTVLYPSVQKVNLLRENIELCLHKNN